MVYENILIVGGFGVGNYGDEAILSGLLSELSRDAKKTVVSQNPKETSRLHKVSAVYPVDSLAALLKSNRLIIAGGGLFSEYMGKRGKMLPLFSILANVVGVKVEYWGLGIYPNTPKLLLPSIKASIKLARNVSVRDRLSKEILAKMGLHNVSVRRDLAFSMAPAPRERAIEILKTEKVDLSKKLVGVSITRANVALAGKVALFIRNYLKRNSDNLEILMIPMFRYKKNTLYDDVLYSQQVTQGFSNVKILKGNYHPSEILSIFGLLENSICMRFHSMIFSYRMGIKMIPIPYTEKCSEFLDSVSVKAVEL